MFKKGKASKFTYYKISPPEKVYNIIIYIQSSNAYYNHFITTTL